VKAWTERLRDGLSRSRQGWVRGVSALLQSERRGDEALRERIEELLLGADLGPRVALELAAQLASGSTLEIDASRDPLREALLGRLDGCEGSIGARPGGELTVLLVAGVNGAGKTTTVAKLASWLRERDAAIPLTFAAADTFRAAAAEQLAVWAERVGADLVRQEPGADPAAVVFDAIGHAQRVGGALLIDTAGRLQTRHNLMEELRKIERTVEKRLGRRADERLLVLDATTGQNGVSQALRFHEAIGLTGIVLTKLDGTAKGGIVFAVWEALGVPLTAIGIGERMEDLRPFRSEEFVDALLR
jgi:fused signal recognition particle receptor